MTGSIAAVVTMGFGTFGSAKLVVTMGYGNGSRAGICDGVIQVDPQSTVFRAIGFSTVCRVEPQTTVLRVIQEN